jgi:hypothetical protein
MKRKFLRGLPVLCLLSLIMASAPIQVRKSQSLPQKSQALLSSKAAPPKLALTSMEQKVDESIIPLIIKVFGEKGSLVDRSVGAAEGTRFYDGAKVEPAYSGHQDPMCRYNFTTSCHAGITNIGSFSYQQGADKPRATNPQQADLVQRQILRLQALELLYQAKRRGMDLTLFQLLAGIDLANQSPISACVQQPDKTLVYKLAAGIDPDLANTSKVTAKFSSNSCRWGYIDRLAQALSKKGLRGEAAVVEARKWAFFEVDPSSSRFNMWSAAGLGHNPAVIEADQLRRTEEVAKAIRYHIDNVQQVSD